MSIHKRAKVIVRSLITFFGLTALAFAQDRPLDNIASRQYQHEIRSLSTAGCTSWGSKSLVSAFGL